MNLTTIEPILVALAGSVVAAIAGTIAIGLFAIILALGAKLFRMMMGIDVGGNPDPDCQQGSVVGEDPLITEWKAELAAREEKWNNASQEERDAMADAEEREYKSKEMERYYAARVEKLKFIIVISIFAFLFVLALMQRGGGFE